MLKPYMHGYLLTNRLHEQLYEMVQVNKLQASIAEGATDEEVAKLSTDHRSGAPKTEVQFIHDQIAQQLAKQRDSGFKAENLPVVNQNYALSILERQKLAEELATKGKKKKQKLQKMQKMGQHNNQYHYYKMNVLQIYSKMNLLQLIKKFRLSTFTSYSQSTTSSTTTCWWY
eukprot:UN01515